jgi:Heterokaryon incompatibility protein (HET)
MGRVLYNVCTLESVQGQSCSPEHSVSRFIDPDWPLYRARLWLDTCIDKHSRCSKRAPGWLPTRLLDLNESMNGIIHLVETKGMGNGAIENYMTLSHCWGKADTYKLTSETASHLLTGLRISLLPRTFQRTIDVVRSLGTKYLWIDSLCIIQSSTADWEQESAQMGQVYSNGLLNIAATGSTDGEGGLLRERPSKLPLESTACYVSSSWTDHCNSNLLVHRRSLPSRMLLDGP